MGVLNDRGEGQQPEVIIWRIRERPGLGRAASRSAPMASRPQAGDTDADHGMVSHLCANGDIDPRASAACILALAQPRCAVAGGGGVERGAQVERGRGETPTRPCVPGGEKALVQASFPLQDHALEGPCTRACMPERRQDDHPATPRPVSDDEP